VRVQYHDAAFDEVTAYQQAVTTEVGITTRFTRDGDRIVIG
jgi:hypothetical protein